MTDTTTAAVTPAAVTPAAEGVKRGRGRPRIYDFPSVLTCSVTGKTVKTNPTQMKKMIEKSGLDLETFLKTYKSRAARKAERAAAKPVKATPATPPVEG